MGYGTSRREFIKGLSVIGGLGAAGALALKKEYVKPAVRLLEPSLASAQSPGLVVTGAAFTVSPMNITLGQTVTILTLSLDVPGGSPCAPGQLFNAQVSMTNTAGSWGSGCVGIPFSPSETRMSNVMDNVGVSGQGGMVTFELDISPGAMRLNGAPIIGPEFPPPPHTWGSVAAGINCFLNGSPDDVATLCVHVDADSGMSMGGMPYMAQHVGSFCVVAMHS